MPQYKLTPDELQNALSEQIQFLRASAASFDNGFEGEAKRLAAAIRVLVHDTKNSKSLLQLLNIKGAIRMVATAHPFYPDNLAPHNGLVVMRLDVPGDSNASLIFTLFEVEKPHTEAPKSEPGTKVTFLPRCNVNAESRGTTAVSFNDWWNEIVVRDKLGAVFSRKELVLAMANKEGGAHVDPQLDETYARLTRFNSLG